MSYEPQEFVTLGFALESKTIDALAKMHKWAVKVPTRPAALLEEVCNTEPYLWTRVYEPLVAGLHVAWDQLRLHKLVWSTV